MMEFIGNAAIKLHTDAFRLSMFGASVPFAGEVRPFDLAAMRKL